MNTYNESQLSALKTICGGIHYDLIKNSRNEIWPDGWEHLSSYLKMDKTTIYSVEEVTISSFLFRSKELSFRYHHDDFHNRRTIEFIR